MASGFFVRPPHFHDLQMPIRKIIPVNNRKATGHVDIEQPPRWIMRLVVSKVAWVAANSVKALAKELPIPLFQKRDEIHDCGIDEKTIFQSSDGGGTLSTRAQNSSPDSHSVLGSSSFLDASWSRLAHRSSRRVARKTSSSTCDFSSREAASCFKASKLIAQRNHIGGRRANSLFSCRL